MRKHEFKKSKDKGTEPRNQKTCKALNQLGERVKHGEGDNNLHGSTTRSEKNSDFVPTAHDGSQNHPKFKVHGGGNKKSCSEQCSVSENAKHRHSRLPQDLGHSCITRNACSTGHCKIKSNKFNELTEKKPVHVGKHKKQLATSNMWEVTVNVQRTVQT